MKSTVTPSLTNVFLGIASLLSLLISVVLVDFLISLPYSKMSMFFYWFQCNAFFAFFGFLVFVFFTFLQILFNPNESENENTLTIFSETDFFYNFVCYFGYNLFYTFIIFICAIFIDIFFFEILHFKTMLWYVLIVLYSLLLPILSCYFIVISYSPPKAPS